MASNNSDPCVAKEIVLSFIQALNYNDLEKARTYVNDDLAFVGVMGTRNGAEAYFKDMEKMKLKYKVKKSFADENDVGIFANIIIDGVTVFACVWYTLINNEISRIKVIFDPRPLLNNSDK